MAETPWFTPKEWKARLVEFAGRRNLRNVATGETSVVDVTRNEGQISQEGDAFSAQNLNGLEQRIKNGFDKAKETTDQISRDLCGCWIEFTDEDGNPTTEPYVHWMEETEE